MMVVEGGEGLRVRVRVMMVLLLLLLVSNLHLRRCQSHRRCRLPSIRHEIQIQIQIHVERRSRRIGVVGREHHRREIHSHRWEGEMIEVEEGWTSRVGRVDEISCCGMMSELEDGGVGSWGRSGRSCFRDAVVSVLSSRVRC